VSGKVTASDARGLRNASVTIVDQTGFAKTGTTSASGYYAFGAVAPDNPYTITVTSRLYRFAALGLEERTTWQTLTLLDANDKGFRSSAVTCRGSKSEYDLSGPALEYGLQGVTFLNVRS
jgi:hypothetical protein